MPLVNTSRTINGHKRRYMCTRGGLDGTEQHDKPKRISTAQWEQDGMCSDCAEYVWSELIRVGSKSQG